MKRPPLRNLLISLCSFVFLCQLNTSALAGEPALPEPDLTPGECDPNFTVADICHPGFSRTIRPSRTASTAWKKIVFARYHIPWSKHEAFQLDHLVPLEIGGTSSLANLWPEPTTGRWNAYVKDDYENWLRAECCAGRLSLRAAQEQIALDWIQGYKRAFGDPYQ